MAGRNYLDHVSFGTGSAVQYKHDKADNIVQENGSRHLSWNGSRHLSWDGANRLR
ncbi:hypothetical protein Q5H93_23530 [Hymenobacter sp. ASUV-10]|uniref:Uncharacterized protein n=1 Tax=Hymenobacter aranciens TaxID=3063996 RepID=A0ABT9BHI0_9BACT|nr:hypothetical protein [Hymenobacter sp. ASUV-10]MDO7877728.1 hypothetical protein [Hymenobacter sp. ASUV-10]